MPFVFNPASGSPVNCEYARVVHGANCTDQWTPQQELRCDVYLSDIDNRYFGGDDSISSSFTVDGC